MLKRRRGTWIVRLRLRQAKPGVFAGVTGVFAIYTSVFDYPATGLNPALARRHESPFRPQRAVPCSSSSHASSLLHSGCWRTASLADPGVFAIDRRSDDGGIQSVGRSQRHSLRRAGCRSLRNRVLSDRCRATHSNQSTWKAESRRGRQDSHQPGGTSLVGYCLRGAGFGCRLRRYRY